MVYSARTQRNPTGAKPLESTELAHRIVDLVADKKASDIVLLDLRDITTMADYFIICTSESSRQTQAIVDDTVDVLRAEGRRSIHREGAGDSGWVLVDYGDVILHVFAPVEREYYRLEQMWKAAPVVVHVQ
jgi:ribosome-associated protein